MPRAKPLWNKRKFFTIIFNATLIICCYLFFSQQSVPTNIAHSDKYGHILAFFTLSLLLHKSTALSIIKQIILLTCFGVAVAVIQSYIPYRSGGVDDVVADVIGILLFYCAARLVLQKFSKSKLSD